MWGAFRNGSDQEGRRSGVVAQERAGPDHVSGIAGEA